MWVDYVCCFARPTWVERRILRYSIWVPRLARLTFRLVLLLVIVVAPKVVAQGTEEFDSYKLRFGGFWVYSTPTGTLQGSADTDIGAIDLTKDLHFNTYSTFFGKLDWKFTHKNHIYVWGSRLTSSKETVLNRTITFEGKTFEAGLTTQANLDSPAYGFGYQYDIIRRRRGHLGLGVQFNIFDSSASIKAAAQVTADGVHHAAVSASASQLAPIPVAGPEFRYYITDSPRAFVDGQVYGMYFFGYGNYVSAWGSFGVTITKHLSAKAGYQLGSRLVVNRDTSTNRIGLDLTEKGPTVGVEFQF
jgi:hypothetical protein